MKASEIMTREVLSVRPDTPIREIARALLNRGISAAPVIDQTGALVGMVSEGDLIGRDETARERRQDWWLSILAEGEVLNPEFLATVRSDGRAARDVMSAPVVAVAEQTDANEIASLLNAYRVKRVPVVRDGRVVGIVSRADLLRLLAAPGAKTSHSAGLLTDAITALEVRVFDRHSAEQPERRASPSETKDSVPKAADLRRLVAEFERQEVQRRNDVRRAEAERNRRRVQQFTSDHISVNGWHVLLQQARIAAEHGETEFMLLRFPNQLCSDRGRAINVFDPTWPTTLRGEAAEIFLRWRHDLKPLGFSLTARVLEFPGGMPGDIGLFLGWGRPIDG